jgi:hypothetical protein
MQRREGQEANVDLEAAGTDAEMADRRRTYKWFVRGVLLFAVHALVILAVLGWVFSDNMG